MSTATAAYAAPSTGAELEPLTISRRDVRGTDVRIDIHYTGVCPTDLLQTSDGWGPGLYPMVPGHEITGLVTEVGAGVTKFAVGDRVGVGTYIDSCGECGPCRAGLEVYCEKGCTPTYNAKDRHGEITQGGYSKQIVVDERYVLRIPDSLPLDAAAPCSAPASPPTRPSHTGTPAPARRSRSSAWVASGTSPSRSPTPWAPKSPSSPARSARRTAA